MATVLVLAAGRRDYVISALKAAAGPDDELVVSDVDPLAAALAISGIDARIEPTGADAANAWLLDTCRERGVDAVLCLHDYRTLEVARLRHELDDIGTLWIGPSADAADLALDKIAFYEHLLKVAPASAVPTLRIRDVSRSIFDTCGSWVVKDRHGSGSSGLVVVGDYDGLRQRATPGESAEVVVQPRLTSEEWNVDLFADADGRLVGKAAKKKLRMRGGETDAAVVVTAPPVELLDACEHALEGMAMIGNIDVDVFAEPDGYKVVDVNPRFGGGYAFSLAAGYDAAGAVWRLADAQPIASFGVTRPFVGAKTINVVELDPAKPF